MPFLVFELRIVHCFSITVTSAHYFLFRNKVLFQFIYTLFQTLKFMFYVYQIKNPTAMKLCPTRIDILHSCILVYVIYHMLKWKGDGIQHIMESLHIQHECWAFGVITISNPMSIHTRKSICSFFSFFVKKSICSILIT